MWTNWLVKSSDAREDVINEMKEVKDIIMAEKDKEGFEHASSCCTCGNEFKPDDKKARYHCCFTGIYRGCAHDDCNLAFNLRYYKTPSFYKAR